MRTILDRHLLDPDTGLEARVLLTVVDLKGMRPDLRSDGRAADGTVPVLAKGAEALRAGDDDIRHGISSCSCGLVFCSWDSSFYI